MAYRDTENENLGKVLANIERRLRALEQPGALPPDPGWIMVDEGGELKWRYVPTGAVGPAIGIRSGSASLSDELTQIQAAIDALGESGTAGGDLTGTYPNPTIADEAVTDAKVAAANKDGAASVPSMRTLGTGASQAAAGNDPRFGSGGASGAAGGVLSGTYPNPGFAVDMATQAELDAVDNRLQALQVGWGTAEYLISGSATSMGTSAPANGALSMLLVTTPFDATAITICADCTVVGSAGALVRFAIYEYDPAGLVGNLVLGTVATDADAGTGIKSIAISQALPKGTYWVGAVNQGAPATNATWRTATAAGYQKRRLTSGGTLAGTILFAARQTGVTGALPATGAGFTLAHPGAVVLVGLERS